MDRLIPSGKLESLRRCIKRIEDKKPVDVGYLIQDPDLQDILVLNLTRAAQLSSALILAAISSAIQTKQRLRQWVRFLQHSIK